MIYRLSSLIALGLICSYVMPASPATAADSAHAPLRDQLVGTWVLVDMDATTWDGNDRNPFGSHPEGRMVLDQAGHATVVIIGADHIPFSTADRLTGTAEENQEAVQTSQAFFGTYSVGESNHSLVFHVERSSFPNWNGTAQESTIKIEGDELTQTKPGPHLSYAVTLWKRVPELEIAGQR